MHSLNSCLSFLCATTIDETQSVGSDTGVLTPLCVIESSSALTHVAALPRGCGVLVDSLYCWVQGHGVGDRELSKLVAEHILVLFKNVLGEDSVVLRADLVNMGAQCDKSQAHTCTKS